MPLSEHFFLHFSYVPTFYLMLLLPPKEDIDLNTCNSRERSKICTVLPVYRDSLCGMFEMLLDPSICTKNCFPNRDIGDIEDTVRVYISRCT